MSRTARPAIRIDDLPLFADDAQIAEAVVGPDPDRIREWCATVSTLEVHGFPRPTKLYKRRYTPAVKAYYDREYGLAPDPHSQRHDEDRPAWNDRKSRPRA